MSALLQLHAGRSTCRIAPQLGGSVLGLNLAGTEVLRGAPDRCSNVLETACFPLVPFANRLTGGKEHAGRRLDLPPDPEGYPHPLHGHGWRRAWAVESAGETVARLSFLHQADAWPWTYRAVEQFDLSEAALQVTLEVTNQSATAMPCGFGLHPYFALEPGSFIETAATNCLTPDPRGVPCLPADWSAGRLAVADLPACDHFLLDPAGSVRVGTESWALTMTASDVAGWQLYRPLGGDFFCLEPASHCPDRLPAQIEGGRNGAFHTQIWRAEFSLER